MDEVVVTKKTFDAAVEAAMKKFFGEVVYAAAIKRGQKPDMFHDLFELLKKELGL